MTSPTQINALHNKAMDLAGRAFHADLHSDYPLAESLFREAFDLERQAALLLVQDEKAEPTRSVLLRSAATLAVDCREFREAERLIAIALSGSPPSEIADELRDLLETVYFSRHLSVRGFELDSGEFQVSLTGASIGFGVAESGQFLRRVDIAEKLLVRTMERLREIPFRETGSPNKETMDGFEVYFSTPRAASFAITIRLGRPERQGLLPGFIGPKQVVDEFLSCMAHFNAEEVPALRERIHSEPYFNNFTALTRKLAPDGQKIRTVGFTSIRGDESKQVTLTRRAGTVWRGTVNEQGREQRIVGVIRSADESSKRGDHPVFGVEDDNRKTHTVRVLPGILQDIVKPYWGERVTVVVSRIKRGQLQLIDIEPDEQGPPSNPTE